MPWQRASLLLAALLLLVGLVYAPVLGASVLDWDDPVWLQEDPILGLDAGDAFVTALTTSRDHTWSPALRTSFWLLQRLFGEAAGPKHGFVLLLFLASLPAVYRLLRVLGVPEPASLLATALWALHPARVESVAWLTGLKDTQSLLLLSLAFHTLLPEQGAPRSGRVALGTLLCAGALWTKAAVFPVPFAFAVALWARRGRSALWPLAPSCLLALLAAVIGRALWSTRDWPEMPRMLLTPWVHGVFWRTTFDPSPAAVVALPSDPLPLALVGVAATGILLRWAVRSPRVGGPVLALWLLPQVPFCGLVPMAFWGSSRHTLYPMLALAVLAAFALHEALSRLQGAARGALIVAITALLSLEAYATRQRANDWQSSRSLWESEVARADEHWVRWMKVGTVRGIAGEFPTAEAAFDRALRLKADPDTLARRLIASLAADGTFTQQDAALARLLQPPPPDGRAWIEVVAALHAAGEEDLARFADDVLRR